MGGFICLITPSSYSICEKILWIKLIEAKKSEKIHTKCKSEAELGTDQTHFSGLQSLLHQTIPSEVRHLPQLGKDTE